MKSYNILFLLLSLIALSSCGEDFFNQVVDIDIPEHEPLLAVSGHFRAQDTTLTVFVSRSAGILDPVNFDTLEVAGATVEVLKDGEAFQTLPNVGSGYFRLNLEDQLGAGLHTYSLEVRAPGYGEAKAWQTMPAPVPIQDAVYEAEGGIDPDGNKVNTLSVEFEDPAGNDNYYFLEAFVTVTDTFFGDWEYTIYLESEDVLVEYQDRGLLFRDGPIDGKQYALKAYFFDNIHLRPDAQLTVRLHSISRDRYLFLRTLDLYSNAQDNPFAEPVVVHNNVEGGVGIFSVEAADAFLISF